MADGEGLAASGNQRGKGSVTSEHWKRIEALFERCLETSAPARAQFLQAIEDDETRREVESLLQAHTEAGRFLDEPEAFLSIENAEGFAPDNVVDRYRIIREIGRGGMGAVFLAERADEQYEKQVALKLIKRGTDTDSVLRHFRNERQILAGFDHPNIARLLDGGTTSVGLPYFVMEYIDGLSIDEYCATHALSIAARLELFRAVCAAVSYAHRHLVIHRDIKRSNILVTAEGVPKLLDFGIAKILQQSEEAAPWATLTGQRQMTPESASPEQARGERVTTASDVYSLGVVLYELLTGQSPYGSITPSPKDFEKVISEVQPKRPSTVLAKIENPQSAIRNPKFLRGDLDNIVLMALRKEPERRYSSVEQFSEDIRRHLEERPVLARQDTTAYRASKFMRRNKTAFAAAALVLLVLLGGIIATTREAQKARAQEAVAKAEQARAERRFNDVRKLANRVLFDHYDAIKNLPGATKARELLVKDALSYLDSLAGEASGNPGLQRELADAYERVGDVRGGISVGHLGDRAGALESYTKSLAIREAVVASGPGDAQARRDLAVIHKIVGYAYLNTTTPGKGLEHLRTSVILYRSLTQERPADSGLQLALADTYNKLGAALKVEGDLAAAPEPLGAALAICERLAATGPLDQLRRRVLLSTKEEMANTWHLLGEDLRAIAANDEARTLAEALLRETPENLEYRHALLRNLHRAADYRKQSEPDRALEFLQRSLGMEEELIAADPVNAVIRASIAETHKRISDFAANQHKDAEGLLHFTKALELFEQLGTEAPDDLPSRFNAAACRAGAAGMQARLGDLDSALQNCRRADELLRGIAEQPTNARHRVLRAEVHGVSRLRLRCAGGVPENSGRRDQAARERFARNVPTRPNCARGLARPWQTRRCQRGLAQPDKERDRQVRRSARKLSAGNSTTGLRSQIQSCSD